MSHPLGRPSTNFGHEYSNGWRTNGSRFGVGGLVPGGILGFGGRVRGERKDEG